MNLAENKISSLVKLLEPYFRRMIRDILGPIGEGNPDALTFIQGGEFYRHDQSSGYMGTDAVHLGDWDWDASETARAVRSATVGAFSCITYPDAPDSIAWGWGGVCYKNPCAVSGGFEMYDKFESQAARYTESNEIEISSSWQTIGSIYFREAMHAGSARPDDKWNTAGIHAYISGTEIDGQRSYSYKVIATTKLRNGTITLLQNAVTTFYESDTNFDLQVVINDVSDSLDFQVKDSGNSGRSVKWCIHARTAEAIGTSIYHQP